MKKLILIFSVAFFGTMNAQVKDYIGKWDLCKVVTAKGDTQLIKNSDPRFVWYNFEYNNTFTSFGNEKKEEITGRFGYEFKTKTLKIKNPMLSKTRTAIGDYDIVVNSVTPTNFVEVRQEGKKAFSYWIYCRVK
ncbi:MAG: hypothetical protein ACXVPN_02785 [Bacteroidia bacterium]